MDQHETALRHPGRLRALLRTGLLDSNPEPGFDRLTRMAAQVLHAPLCLINLVDDQRQFSKSCFAPLNWSGTRDTPLQESFCKLTVITDHIVQIDDAQQDERVAETATVRDMGLRAYLGVPLRDLSGYVLGALCVADFVPRNWQPDQVDLLTAFADLVLGEIDLRAAVVELQEGQTHYRALLEEVPEAIVIVDAEGRLLESNERAHRLFRRTSRDMLALDLSFVLSADVTEHTMPDGSVATFLIERRDLGVGRVMAVLRPESQPLPTPDLIPESTASGQAENLHAQILESIQDYCIALLSMRGEIKLWTRGAEIATGYPREEAIGRHISIIYSADDVAHGEPQRALAEAAGEGRAVRSGWRVRRDGARYWNHEILTLLRTDGGEEGIVKIAYDATPEHTVHEALDEQREFQAALLEHMSEGVVACDANGMLTLFNHAAREFHTIPEEPLPAESWAQHYHLYRLDGTVMSSSEVPLARAFNGEIIENVEMLIRPPGQTERIVQASGRAMYSRDGHKLGAVVTMRDVTEQKKIEEKTIELIREQIARGVAEQANKAKSEFLSRMSHELRTPLNAILGFTQLMRDETEDEEAVRQILAAGRHLLLIIDEVLDLARIEEGRMPLTLQPVAVPEIVTEILELVAPLAAQRSVSVEIDRERFPLLHVQADRQRCKQILLNFVSNAIKYNRPGGRVWVECRPRNEQDVCISVCDDGPGIPAEQQARLFTPFDRLGAELNEPEGTGLGLSLSKGLADAMGGRITVDSDAGRGSCFMLDLPRAEADIKASYATTAPMAAANPTVDRQATILYIEDHSANVRLVERIFARRPKNRLLTALQGNFGLELAHKFQPDLLLVDRNLPDISGIEIVKHLRQDPFLRRTPIVMVSGDAIPEHIAEAMAVGVDAYLTKPFDITHFLSVIDRLLFQ